MSVPATQQTRAILAVAGGAMILGLAPVGMRLSVLGAQPTAFWRFLFALPVLLLATRVLRAAPPARPDTGRLLLAGVFFALDIGLWHAALGKTTVANATLFSNMTPVIAAAAGWIFYKERLSVSWFVGAGLAAAGAVAMSLGRAQQGVGHLSGDLLGLASMVWYAGYLLVMREARTRVSAVMSMALTTTAALASAALISFGLHEPLIVPAMTLGDWAVLAGLGFVVHCGGQGFIAYGLGKLPIALSTVLLFMQPVAAALFGWVLFHEPLGPLSLVGAGAILAGVFIVQRGRR